MARRSSSQCHSEKIQTLRRRRARKARRRGLWLEQLEERALLNVDLPFRVWTQNTQLRPNDFREAFPPETYAAGAAAVALASGGAVAAAGAIAPRFPSQLPAP